jgi:hypothetical protein
LRAHAWWFLAVPILVLLAESYDVRVALSLGHVARVDRAVVALAGYMVVTFMPHRVPRG